MKRAKQTKDDIYKSGTNKTAKQKDAKTASVEKVKCTYYLPAEAVELLEDVRYKRRKRRKAGGKADLSDLVTLSGLVTEAVLKVFGGSFDASAEAFEAGRARDKATR